MKLSGIAAFALTLLAAACATSAPDNSLAYRPGYGVVESVREARVAIPGGAITGSPAAGGSYQTPGERLVRPRWTEGYQLALRMDDGSTQTVTQDSPAFSAGERVQVTRDGRVVKVAEPVAPTAPAPVSSLRPGVGTVESIALVQPATAAAGGTTPIGAANVPQYTVRMADGTTQLMQVQGVNLQLGERIRITDDGRVQPQ